MNCLMRWTPFLVAYSKPANQVEVINEVNDNDAFWFPVIAGVATREEMERATMKEVQILNEVASRKLELLRGDEIENE